MIGRDYEALIGYGNYSAWNRHMGKTSGIDLAPELPDRCDVELAKRLYDLEGVRHPFVQRWNPDVIGRGGEHIVYRSQTQPDTVLKVNVELLEKAIAHPGQSTSSEIKAYIERTNARYNDLISRFPSFAVPPQHLELAELPVTEGMLRWQFRRVERPAHLPAEVQIALSIQEFVPAFLSDSYLSIISGYAEKRLKEVALFERLNKLLDPSLAAADGSELYRSLQMPDSMRQIVEALKTDSSLCALLRKFVIEACAYSDATGETLDLAGRGNVLFLEEDGCWKGYLADALYPGTPMLLARTRAIIECIARGDMIDAGDANILMNGLNYVRTINGLAHLLNIDERLDVNPSSGKAGLLDLHTPILTTQLGPL